jgi:hypothetical protein
MNDKLSTIVHLEDYGCLFVLFSIFSERVVCWITYFWSNLDIVCDVLLYYVLLYNNWTRFWIISWGFDIRRFGFGSEFSLEQMFGLDLDFSFGLWVWVPWYYIRSEFDPLPSLPTTPLWPDLGAPSHFLRPPFSDHSLPSFAFPPPFCGRAVVAISLAHLTPPFRLCHRENFLIILYTTYVYHFIPHVQGVMIFN